MKNNTCESFPKDENGDWDWRNDRARNPRLIREDAQKSDIAVKIIVAMDVDIHAGCKNETFIRNENS